MQAKIYITLKKGVLDPQGKAIQNALGHLGFNDVENVRQGKLIELNISETDKSKAEETVQEMCEKLLANMVIENYKFELV